LTRAEILNLLVLIESVYTNFVTKDEMVLFWFKIGPYLDCEKVLEKVRSHIRKSPYPPSVEDLIDFSGDMLMPPLSYTAGERGIRGNRQYSLSAWMREYSIR
jgi:hypothetical protein